MRVRLTRLAWDVRCTILGHRWNCACPVSPECGNYCLGCTRSHHDDTEVTQ